MVISRSDVTKVQGPFKTDFPENLLVTVICAYIDELISANYCPGKELILQFSKDAVVQVLLDIVVDLYKEAGWKVTATSLAHMYTLTFR